MKTHVLSIMVENYAGVLSRVTGLFSRRMYNIDSLSVGETENPQISRITIALRADEKTFNQIKNQIAKLENVIEIIELKRDNAVMREHVLIKVSSKDQAGVMQLCDIFRARIIDISRENMTAELTGSPNKISAFIELMDQYEVKDLVRTGLTGLERG
ncbi:MAG: acetolactate synthase small subunit [Clostridia bacterium]|nr:acetolactate synthase small subunit [Clostridia bacterium]